MDPTSKKSRLSKPHPRFEAPQDWELGLLLQMRGYKNPLPVDINHIWAGMDAYSHHVLGENALDCLEQSAEALKLSALLQDFPIQTLSGNSALEKGLSFAALVQAVERQDEPLPQAVKTVKDALQQLKDEKPEEDGDEPGSGFGDRQPEDRLIQEMDADSVRFLAALARIKSLKTANIGKAVEREIDLDSLSHAEMEYMTDLTSQLGLVNPNDLVDPFLLQKLADMDFEIEIPYRLVEKKKFFLLIIDRSSSMYTPKMKQAYVRGMLAHLFEGVKKGTAVVAVATFEERIDLPWTLIQTEKEADDYFAAYECMGGSNTEVNNCLHEAESVLKAGEIRHRTGVWKIPADYVGQIVIVNDGQDHVDAADVPACEVHAIMLHQHNRQLQRLCEKTKGSYHSIV